MKPALFIFSIFSLCAIGLLFIFGISPIRGGYAPYIMFKKQVIAVAIGILLMFLVSRIPHELLRKISVPIFVICLIGTISTLFLGKGSAKRWIHFPGFSIQPVEFFKVAYIILFSNIISKVKEQIDIYGFMLFVLANIILTLPILIQPDYGNFIIIFTISTFLLFIKGVKIRYILSLLLPAIPAFVALIFISPYRIKRILAFLSPWEDPQGKGFQIIQSMISYSAGGIKGEGIGEGMQKLYFLPAAHTDFIISSIAEEIGLIGIAIIVLLFSIVTFIGFSAAKSIKEEFPKLLTAGLTFMIAIEVIINLFVSVGLLPAKGLPLPFVSYGGSSIISSFIAAGIILQAITKD